MKERLHCKCYLQYCDDITGLARSKAEAWKALNEFTWLSKEAGFVVKCSTVVAPIAHVRDGRKKKRKRQRGHRRKAD